MTWTGHTGSRHGVIKNAYKNVKNTIGKDHLGNIYTRIISVFCKKML
jgi:hypothetical protein